MCLLPYILPLCGEIKIFNYYTISTIATTIHLRKQKPTRYCGRSVDQYHFRPLMKPPRQYRSALPSTVKTVSVRRGPFPCRCAVDLRLFHPPPPPNAPPSRPRSTPSSCRSRPGRSPTPTLCRLPPRRRRRRRRRLPLASNTSASRRHCCQAHRCRLAKISSDKLFSSPTTSLLLRKIIISMIS